MRRHMLTPARGRTVRDDSIRHPVERACRGRGGPRVNVGALGLGREGVQLPIPVQVRVFAGETQKLAAISRSEHLPCIVYCARSRESGTRRSDTYTARLGRTVSSSLDAAAAICHT
jgi:hypothetical protein